MENETNIMEDIKQFIFEKTQINCNKLSPESKILEDVGLDGDEAYKFLNDFSEKFDTDLSGLNFDSYFNSEGFDIISFLKSLVKKSSRLQPITLKDLEIAVLKKKWIQNRVV